MKDLSIIIPYGNPGLDRRRDDLFEFVYSWWSFYLPDSQIITHAVFDSDGGFNRSASRNAAVAIADTRYLVIADADTICPPSALVQAFDYIDAQLPYASWVLPYGNKNYYNLTKECTDNILNNGVKQQLPPEDLLIYDHKLQSWAGILCMTKSAFDAVEGYDERFIGWGYEDNSFRLCMDTLWSPHARIDSYCVHLWHDAPEEKRFNQPDIQHNKRLYDKYFSAFGSRSAMKNLRGLN